VNIAISMNRLNFGKDVPDEGLRTWIRIPPPSANIQQCLSSELKVMVARIV